MITISEQLRDLQRKYDEAGVEFEDGILSRAADLIELYFCWLDDRDCFLVETGMWDEFISYLEKTP